MAWLYLVLAGLTEIGWAFGLKYSDGFRDPIPAIITVILIVTSFVLFSKAMNSIPIGTAYAIFTGIGAAGTAILGMLFLNEQGGAMKILLLCLLLSGIVGLKLTSGKEEEDNKGKGTVQ